MCVHPQERQVSRLVIFVSREQGMPGSTNLLIHFVAISTRVTSACFVAVRRVRTPGATPEPSVCVLKTLVTGEVGRSTYTPYELIMFVQCFLGEFISVCSLWKEGNKKTIHSLRKFDFVGDKFSTR